MSKKSIIVLVVLALSINNVSLIFASDISSLIKDLKDKESAKDASYELAKIGKPAVPELIKALESRNKYQKRYAARAIREMGQAGSDAIPALEKLIKDRDTQTREYAVEALGNMVQQVDQVIPILKRARKDNNKDVRKKAKSAIEKLQKPETLSVKDKANTQGSSEPSIIHALEAGIYKIPFNASIDEILKLAQSNNMDIANDTEQKVRERVREKTSRIKQLKKSYEADKQLFFSALEQELMELNGSDEMIDSFEKEEIKKIQDELLVLKNTSLSYNGQKYYLKQVFKDIKVEIDQKTLSCTDNRITKTVCELILRPTEKSEKAKNNGLEEISIFLFSPNGQNFLSYATFATFRGGYSGANKISQVLTQNYGVNKEINCAEYEDKYSSGKPWPLRENYVRELSSINMKLDWFGVNLLIWNRSIVMISKNRGPMYYFGVLYYNHNIVNDILTLQTKTLEDFKKEYYRKKQQETIQMKQDF